MFEGIINATCRYKSRTASACISIKHTVDTPIITEPPLQEHEPVSAKTVQNEAIVYDTLQDLYEITNSGKIGRMGAFSASVYADSSSGITSGIVVGYVYVIGGLANQSSSPQNPNDISTATITPYGEVFNLSTNEWSFIANMPTPRACGQTAIYGNYIYCIGGVSKDLIVPTKYTVSNKLEVYNHRLGYWITLSDMPTDYGVAFGVADVIDNYIYVLSGINSLKNNSQPDRMNDRVLRYSIVDDQWDIIVPADVSSYKRISPFGFVRTLTNDFYVYGGSIRKPDSQVEQERSAKVDQLIAEFRSSILTSTYFLNLTFAEQTVFQQIEEAKISEGVIIPAFIYPSTGFRFGTSDITEDLNIDLHSIEDEWTVFPKQRDRGQAVYILSQDTAYFIGGSNQNQSTTLNRVESINFSMNNLYTKLTSLNQGRSMFSAVTVGADIYFIGGFTSGHKAGWVQVDVSCTPQYIEAQGIQSSGLLIRIFNDSGEIVDSDIRVDIKGRVRIAELDNLLTNFFAKRGADRALGGDGSGTASDLPNEGDQVDIDRLIKSQNSILDPNSDEFQFNAARKLGEQVYLFPVLYSETELTLINGVGGIILKPRSEDPLEDFNKIAEFIQQSLDNTPSDPNQKFEGDLTREELAALGESLAIAPPTNTIINSGKLRDLYEIETIVTILDDYYFGQNVSAFDLNIQGVIKRRIEQLLTPPPPDSEEPVQDPIGGSGLSGTPGTGSCSTLYNIPSTDIPPPDYQGTLGTMGNRGSPGGPGSSGTCLFCDVILPLSPSPKEQLLSTSVKYFNNVDWIPQVKKYLNSNNSTISELLEVVDNIEYEVPFGGSPLYDSLNECGVTMTGDDFYAIKKVIYVCSDNSQNVSTITWRKAVEEINSIDGDKKTPIIYVVFSTSFPTSLSTQLQQTEVGDIVKLTDETGGQSITLTASRFLNQIVNFSLGSATGGLGYGIYKNTLTLSELTAFTAISPDFVLPVNTNGYIRFKKSSDGYNYSDWSEKYEGNDIVDFSDFFAKSIIFEVVLTTGFVVNENSEYISATGIPKLKSITFDTSTEREDYIYLQKEDTVGSVQQIAVSFDGHIPVNGIVDVGVSPSNSHDWKDFSSPAQPSVKEFGKIVILDRTHTDESLVPIETLTTENQLLYSSNYGSWNPSSYIRLYEVIKSGDVEILSGFKMFPRSGQIMFNTRQDPSKIFRISIQNPSEIRVGLKIRNRLHTDTITVGGAGYVYSTNEEKPPELSQVAPSAIRLHAIPQNPTAGDTFFAEYIYVDLNNDDEKGSLISWFKNGKQLFEIINHTSWSNAELLLENKLEPGDQVYFTVRPSDGKSYGVLQVSPYVTIGARQPGIDGLKLVPYRNEILNDRFDTSSRIMLEYSFFSEDTGSAGVEYGTIISWFVNGTLFKSGTFSATDPPPKPIDQFNIKWLDPLELSGGTFSHEIGNQIYCEVTPRTLVMTGEILRTETATVQNSIPIARNVIINPTTATPLSTLTLSYTIDDRDILKGEQNNQSEIKWYKSVNGKDYVEQSSLRQSVTVSPSLLFLGHKWYATVTPYDSIEVGVTVQSNIKTII